MAVASTLLPPMDIPIFGKHVYCGQFKGLMDKTPLYSFRLPLSSHSVPQDALSFYVLNNLHGPLSPRCTKFNGLLCRSFLKPSGGNEIPILKAAATIISRAYSNLQGSPLVLQLVPAVGILVFAACGLVPLIQFGRTIFLNTDGSWKKNGEYYITASSVQPLLLWIGAMLVCRALDPLILSSTASQVVKQRLLNFIRSLSTVLAFAYCLSSLIKQSQKFFVESKDSTDTRNMGFDFAGKSVYTAVWIAAASLFMELLGFSTQKWLTAGGLGTVLLTLAGREILTNFLSSVMIHATQPFIPNDWIQTNIGGYDVSGTVEHVGWWSPTVIRADDREAVHIPSHKFTMNVVRNLSQRTHWRVKTHIGISHLDVNKISSIVADMRKVLAKNPQVEQQKLHRRVFLDNVDSESQALLIMVSCFIKTSRFEEYLCAKESLLLDFLRVISHHRARLATPIRTVQKVYGETDETVPFTETIFTSTRAASNRRLLLIGSSYKVNDADKPGTADPSVHPDEGKVENVEVTSTLDTKVAASILDDDKVDGRGCLASNSNGNSKTTIGTNSTPDTLQNMDLFDSEESNSIKARTDEGKVEKVEVTSTLDTMVAASILDDDKVDGRGCLASNSNGNSKTTIGTNSTPDTLQNMDLFDSEESNSIKPRTDSEVAKEDAAVTSLKVDDALSEGKEITETQCPSIQELRSNEAAVASTTLQTMPDVGRRISSSPSTSKNSLEDNIVLGVALEGSKMMLPIEEEVMPTATLSEQELAGHRNGNGLAIMGTDKEDEIKEDPKDSIP